MKRSYAVSIALIILALASLYYVSNGLPFKNVDLIKSTTSASLIQLDVAKADYYRGASGYLVIPRISGKLPGVVMIHEWGA